MAKPKRIILIRHGQSEANLDKNMRASKPDHRMELTEAGMYQAMDAGAKLSQLVGNESIRAYISPYMRTRQTFEYLRKGPTLNIMRSSEDPRIREQDFGHLRAQEAFELIDAERSAFGTFFYRIPDGESGADVYDRISSFLDSLWRDFEKPDYPDNALIVTHGLTTRLFVMRWLHWSVEYFERLRNPFNCEQFILELDQSTGKYKLLTPFREYLPEETEQWKNETRAVVLEKANNL